jgi:hypothetical protein
MTAFGLPRHFDRVNFWKALRRVARRGGSRRAVSKMKRLVPPHIRRAGDRVPQSRTKRD